MKWYLFLFVLVFVVSCSNTEEKQPTPEPQQEVVKEVEKTFPTWEAAISSSFSSSIVKSSNFENGLLTIELGESSAVDGYYDSGDKVNKFLSIEPVRLFYKIQDMNSISMNIDIKAGKYNLNITKAELEKYYGISIDEMREFGDNGNLITGDNWRNQFSNIYDDKDNRAKFVKQFVK